MKTQTNSTFAKLRKFLLVTALVIAPLLAVQTGNAQNTVTATLTTTGGLNSISITQGGSFTLTLGVTTNFITLGYTVFLRSTDGSGLFQLNARTNLDAAFFPDPTTSDALALGNPAGILNPSNARDLGYTGDTINNQPAGTFQLASYTIANIGLMTPGVYHIFLDTRSIMTNAAFMDVSMGGNPQFTITVLPVPEPTTVGLAILGGAALLVVARRKLRA